MSADKEQASASKELVKTGLQIAHDLLADEYRKCSDRHPYGMTGADGAAVERRLIEYVGAITAVGAAEAEIQRLQANCVLLKSENEAFRRMHRDAQEASDRHRCERDAMTAELEQIKRAGLGAKGGEA